MAHQATPQLRTQIDDTTSDYDREKLQERLAKIAGGVVALLRAVKALALMRWDKLVPLIDQANAVHDEFVRQMVRFSVFCDTLKGAGEQ